MSGQPDETGRAPVPAPTHERNVVTSLANCVSVAGVPSSYSTPPETRARWVHPSSKLSPPLSSCWVPFCCMDSPSVE